MARIVLFHSALGLNPGMFDWADRLRAEGHDVTMPDLFDGEVFDNVDDGVAKVDSVGMLEWARRAAAAIGDLPPGRIYGGFSFGAGTAQVLAFDDPDARGLLLLHGAIAPHWLPGAAWPPGLRAQLHYAERDPWVEAEEVDEITGFAEPGALATYVYPGDGHLFGFTDRPDYDAASDALMWERVRDFVRSLGD